jgi:LCP family protein required for cell wall assembly
LSFLWPGLGQFAGGRRRAAAIFAIPAIVVLLIVLYEARQGLDVFAARFLDPSFAMAALLIILGLGAIRIAAVVHAWFMAGGSAKGSARTRRKGQTILAALIAVIVATHGVLGAAAYMDYSTWSSVFGGGELPDSSAGPLPSEAPPSDIYESGSPPDSFGPTDTPPVATDRVTILLTGVDAYVTRSERLYDSIMVVSLDPATNQVAMLSIPRDSAAFPLYFGGTAGPKTKINSLPSYVSHGWIKSPDDAMTTFVKEIGYIVGIPIDYYAVMDLGGFIKMIDLVGGIDIVNPTDIYDPTYDWLDGHLGIFSLTAGPHHLDGKTALAFVRSRHGANNSDYKREGRQQQILKALLHKMATPSMIAQLPSLMETLSSSVRTTFPPGKVADMVALGDQIPPENISGYVLGPPWSDTGLGKNIGVSLSCLRLDKIATLSVQLFGQDSRYFGKKQPDTCPAPLLATPKPVSKPTGAPLPTAAPSK